MKTATVALVVKLESDQPSLTTILSDENEIKVLESAVEQHSGNPLGVLDGHRERIKREEEEFGNYVEELLSQPFLRRDVQDHGVQWLKSKLKIEGYQRAEHEAARVIAEYAYNLYQKNRELKDFFLSGPSTRVRVRVFVVSSSSEASEAA